MTMPTATRDPARSATPVATESIVASIVERSQDWPSEEVQAVAAFRPDRVSTTLPTARHVPVSDVGAVMALSAADSGWPFLAGSAVLRQPEALDASSLSVR